MNIVILDSYTVTQTDLNWESLQTLGILTVYDRTSVNDILPRCTDAQVVITSKVCITRDILKKCPGIHYISVLATGYNNIDIPAASALGIPVSNVPAYSTDAVGQHTIGMLLEICNRIGLHNRSVHDGQWTACRDYSYTKTPLIELTGKTMGIIGFGKIGRKVGTIAKAIGMNILAAGSRPCAEGMTIGKYVDLDTLFRDSDVISLHCPLLPETAGIINKETIAKMKDGVIILNMARGPLIVEQDLADALNCGKVYGAAMDVVSREPIQSDNPLLTAENCFLTPHLAWAPRTCRERIIRITTENVRTFLAGAPQNRVN